MRILIPAYEPDVKLILLISDIKAIGGMEIVLVDDGSGEEYARLFEQAEEMSCIVLRHDRNLGKGAALKTGFRYLADQQEAEGVVCADCDGQHTAGDICKVAAETLLSDTSVVLGSRQFTGKVPLKSRIGNTITRWIFQISAGFRIQDTQTGLRGYPAAMLPWLCTVDGNRYEYELNLLLELKSAGFSIKEKTIQTIYENGNKGSHFRTISDSVRVYLPFLKFSASSITAGLLDFVLLLCFQSILHHLLYSVVLSRSISSIFNYSCNKYLVFSNKHQKHLQSASRYFLLVAAIMLLNYVLLNTITFLGVPLVIAKLMTETILFILSYMVQKQLVFVKSKLT